MAPNSYFGRSQHGERRLGDDFDLLAKWTRAFSCGYPIHSYYLTQLSAEDRAELFFGPPTEFRLVKGPHDTVKLESLQEEVDRIDPEVIGMMRSQGYQRSEARRFELLNKVEDAHDQAEGAAALALSSALLDGVDGPVAEAYSRKVAREHLDSVAATVRARWKAERIERLTSRGEPAPTDSIERTDNTSSSSRVDQMIAEATPYTAYWRALQSKHSPGIASQRFVAAPADATSTRPIADRSMIATGGHALAKVGDNGIIPNQRAVAKCLSPHGSFPEHGSETSVETVDWNSPTYSSEGVSSSSEFESDGGFSAEFDGGVTLLPADLAEELGFKGLPDAAPQTPELRPFCAAPNASSGHLGTGLREAFSAIRASVNNMLDDPTIDRALKSSSVGGAHSTAVTEPVSPRTAHRQLVDQFYKPMIKTEATLPCFSAESEEAVASWHAQKRRIDEVTRGKAAVNTSPGPFADAPASSPYPYPVAKEQPWKGFTCFEVPSTKLGKDQLVPKYWTTKSGKERYLRHKIGDLKLDDAKLRSDRFTGFVARNPVHTFIDLSNIIIGFYDSMKESRGLPVTKRVLAPPFSFKNFDTILTRDRNVAKRIVAGSLSNSYNKRWPSYMIQAQELQYEMNILERVPRPAGSPVRKRKGKGGARDAEVPASGADTSGEECFGRPMKQGEQGVDELLHLKILQSAMDTSQPATMVLATGDAASAQYSDGFKKNIERVLALGWNIELYGWSRNISAAWREPEFGQQWGHQFKIIELDGFCEELFDMTIESLEP